MDRKGFTRCVMHLGALAWLLSCSSSKPGVDAITGVSGDALSFVSGSYSPNTVQEGGS